MCVCVCVYIRDMTILQPYIPILNLVEILCKNQKNNKHFYYMSKKFTPQLKNICKFFLKNVVLQHIFHYFIETNKHV